MPLPLENNEESEWLERYSRQLLLKEVGGAGQHRLGQATVAIVGTGLMTIPLTLYLTAAGIGHLLLLDQPQSTQTHRATLHALNPLVQTTASPIPTTLEQTIEQMNGCNLTLLAHDHAHIRQQFNQAALQTRHTLISGWQTKDLYFISTIHANPDPNPPCLLCTETVCNTFAATHPNPHPDPNLTRMAAGVIGSVLAMETLTLLLDNRTQICYGARVFYPEEGRYDAMPVLKNPHCPACSSHSSD